MPNTLEVLPNLDELIYTLQQVVVKDNQAAG